MSSNVISEHSRMGNSQNKSHTVLTSHVIPCAAAAAAAAAAAVAAAATAAAAAAAAAAEADCLPSRTHSHTLDYVPLSVLDLSCFRINSIIFACECPTVPLLFGVSLGARRLSSGRLRIPQGNLDPKKRCLRLLPPQFPTAPRKRLSANDNKCFKIRSWISKLKRVIQETR